MNFNSQPTSGTLGTERAALFTNDLGREIEILCLEFFNTGTDADVKVEVYQTVKVAQALLSESERFTLTEPRRMAAGEMLEAKADKNNVITWRVNFKPV